MIDYIISIIIIVGLGLFAWFSCELSSASDDDIEDEELNVHLEFTKLIRENEEQAKIILEQEKEIKRLSDKGQDKLIKELLLKKDRAANLINLYMMDEKTSVETHKALDKVLECLIDKQKQD